MFNYLSISLLQLTLPTEHLYSTLYSATIVMLLLCILLFVLAMWINARKNKRMAQQNKLQPLLEYLLEYVILTEEAADDSEEERQNIRAMIARIPNGTQSRKMLLAMVAESLPSLAGVAKTNLQFFAREAGLVDLAAAQLHSSTIANRINAVKHLGLLQATEYKKAMFRLTNAADKVLREEAQLAMVRLLGYTGLRFLKVLDKPLSEWQQVCLLQLMSEQKAPDFSRVDLWLQSSNETVQYFAVRLVCENSLFGHQDLLVKLLQSPSERLRLLVIKTLASVFDEFTSAHLIQHYPVAGSREEKLALIETIGAIADVPACDFIRSKMIGSAGFEKFQLVKAWLRAGLAPEELLENSGDERETTIMISHAQYLLAS